MDVPDRPERSVHGYREVLAPFEDRADQSRELRVGADFQKRPGPCGTLPRPERRTRQDTRVGWQEVSSRSGIVRIGFGRLVGENGDRRGLEFTESRDSRNGASASATRRLWNAAETGTVRVAIRRSERTSPASLDLRGRSRQHALSRCILVGDDHIQVSLRIRSETSAIGAKTASIAPDPSAA